MNRSALVARTSLVLLLGSATSFAQAPVAPAAAAPALWLERLEASYTMEDMRSSHHDTVKIDRAAGVEFF